jgi:phage FluMu gp28-like protein
LEVVIQFNPHQSQWTVLNSHARFKVLKCGRRFGKSLIAQALSVKEAAETCSNVAYITPTYQLAKIFFDDITKNLPKDIYDCNRSDLVINFITGGSIRFFTGERLDNMRGLKFHLAIVDEASYIANLEDGWNNAIRPTLTDYKGKAIFLSTPKGRNFFYSLFMRHGEPDWEAFSFSTYDNPYIDPKEIDDAKRQLPRAVFEQEYMANPMENAANPFGSDNIRACIKPLSKLPPLYYGIDLAKSVDWTVIIGLDKNGDVSYYQRFQKDWKQTKDFILTIDRSKPVLIDSTGVGDAIVEDIQKSFQKMTGFKFSSSSKQQLMEGLASSIHKNEISVLCGVMQDELEIFEYRYTSTGVKYTAPDGFHDDTVIALALADKCRIDYKHFGHYHII